MNWGITIDAEVPVLFIPKKCTALVTDCDFTDNLFIDLNIKSSDTEGNEALIYSGFCNVKLLESFDLNVEQVTVNENNSSEYTDIDSDPVIVTESGNCTTYPPFIQESQVWIDPMRSPFVYNHYESIEPQNHYSICHQTHTNHITVEQHNTYITQNVYNHDGSVHSTVPEQFEHKKFRKQQASEINQQNNSVDPNSFNIDEFECGLFLSQLPEEIMNENRVRDECKYIGLQCENGALKQLMSSDIQSLSKQRKTILYLGHDLKCGQTIQKMAVNDSSVQCSKESMVAGSSSYDGDDCSQPKRKRYQCEKCKQIFDHVAMFRKHVVSKHKPSDDSFIHDVDSEMDTELKYTCKQCGKNIKNKEKFDLHCMRHGDPEFECDKCHKVFASKFTLRTHRKIHSRKYACKFCLKAYSNSGNLKAHLANYHFKFMCDICDYATNNSSDLELHKENHNFIGESSGTDLTESLIDVISETDIITPSPKGDNFLEEDKMLDDIRDADSVIAKVMSNKIFLDNSKKRRNVRYHKVCDVCYKRFDRIGDLKRHLIEHVIKSTLAKMPVTKSGALHIRCEVCQNETFNKIDKYKAHLREHAKLTLYQCTFCNKSFSDSSNFSKHKKIHGHTTLQCDLCQRKFNSKKMLTQHMEYHRNNPPLSCFYCDKVFHFESMLNKHVKFTHIKDIVTKAKCTFCHFTFKSLKDKWDHEWQVHKSRKMIVDCLICGAKFRKYSQLKKHFLERHDTEIPPAKLLLKNRDISSENELLYS